MDMRFDIKAGDFSNAGKASSEIKKMLKRINIDTQVIKRIVVAVYEAEVNVVAHSVGGVIKTSICNNEIRTVVTDFGPGIKNISEAMQEGFSTASKKVREMGFGAGMGLPNIKRNTDNFHIESEVGVGTSLFFVHRFL